METSLRTRVDSPMPMTEPESLWDKKCLAGGLDAWVTPIDQHIADLTNEQHTLLRHEIHPR